MVSSPDPYRRGFAIMVAGYLGDRRFYPQINKLQKDTTPVDDWWAETVAGCARHAKTEMTGNLNLMKVPAEHLPKWLAEARQIPIPQSNN
jgi:hypothetical protein